MAAEQVFSSIDLIVTGSFELMSYAPGTVPILYRQELC